LAAAKAEKVWYKSKKVAALIGINVMNLALAITGMIDWKLGLLVAAGTVTAYMVSQGLADFGKNK
jgi:hypothetical protein